MSTKDRDNRNAVFGGNQNSPATQSVDIVKAELGLDIPVETVPLPTRGKIYPESNSLHNRETVDIRCMTTREEDILTSRALIKKGTVITELIKSCLVDRSINVNDMISGDRNALMVAIRVTGYGPEYDAEIECSECNKKERHDFRLDQLAIKRLEIEPAQPGENLFTLMLPVSKKTVGFKFLTGKDEEEIVLTQERMKKVQQNSESLISGRLRYSIVQIEDKTDRALINAFISKMPARDSLTLRKYIEKNEPGVDMAQNVVCGECGHSEEVQIPIGVSFFWPQS